jgi:hypothetical protein
MGSTTSACNSCFNLFWPFYDLSNARILHHLGDCAEITCYLIMFNIKGGWSGYYNYSVPTCDSRNISTLAQGRCSHDRKPTPTRFCRGTLRHTRLNQPLAGGWDSWRPSERSCRPARLTLGTSSQIRSGNDNDYKPMSRRTWQILHQEVVSGLHTVSINWATSGRKAAAWGYISSFWINKNAGRMRDWIPWSEVKSSWSQRAPQTCPQRYLPIT